jgi:hypothetical protein
MVIVDNLLQSPDRHGTSPQVIHPGSVILVLLLTGRFRLETFLISHKLFLHQEVVLYALQLQKLETTTRRWKDSRKFRCSRGTTSFLLTDASRKRWFPFLLLWLLVFGFILVLVLRGFSRI